MEEEEELITKAALGMTLANGPMGSFTFQLFPLGMLGSEIPPPVYIFLILFSDLDIGELLVGQHHTGVHSITVLVLQGILEKHHIKVER